MKNWIKKDISKDDVFSLSKKYDIDSLTSSILLRRNLTQGKDLMYFLEDDLRFIHNPFLLNHMEDAVDRILDAIDEGEKVLIFGDRDVDGVTSTTILYEYLKSSGVDVIFSVPTGDEAYGMNIETIDEFAKNYGTLIITVDCGISNFEEVKYATSLGIDVIITDHHNPHDTVPENAIIINPKLKDSTYPYPDISGCAVAYKLVEALRFSKTELYKQDICLLDARENEGHFFIECVKLHNLVQKDSFRLDDITDSLKISDTKLINFLRGQQIFVWDEKKVKKVLTDIFGSGVEFNTFDIRPECEKIIPGTGNLSLEQIKTKSKVAKYSDKEQTLIDGFINIFITYINQVTKKTSSERAEKETMEMQLVCLAALADIMPLENENRIFVRQGLKSINSGKIRPGLSELLARLNLLNKKITSQDLSWTLIPAINSTGRMGQPDLAVKIFMEQNPVLRNEIASKIIDLNTERKSLANCAQEIINFDAMQSAEKNKTFCYVINEKMNRGILGLIAARNTSRFNVPSIAISFVDDVAVGSMRSTRGLDCTKFLDQFGDFFINHGGHNMAAGFSFKKEKLDEFTAKLDSFIKNIQLQENRTDDIYIDAELPADYIKPDLLKLVDLFEPYGQNNSSLIFVSKNLKLISYQVLGKTEKQHLKLLFDTGVNIIPVMFWNAADKINKEFKAGDNLNVMYNVERNIFNGMENFQLIALDVTKA